MSTKLQLANYIVTLEDSEITINNTAATWRLEISILSPRYQLLAYMVNTPEMHKILGGYCQLNYLIADNPFIDKQYMDDFILSYTECAKRHNARMKQQAKEDKVKTPKVK